MGAIRTGLVGAGYIGERHLKNLLAHSAAMLVGVLEPDLHRAQALRAKGLGVFNDYPALLDACEAVVIASPTPTHYAYAAEALRRGKHVFVEKPVATAPHELEDLVRLAEEAGTVTMVGHVERFNPAFQAALDWMPQVTMAHFRRLAPFTPRGSEVSVVLDLLTHDLDLVWAMWRRAPSHLHATGACSISEKIDTLHAWLSFPGGYTASFLVSRHSPIRERHLLITGPSAFLDLDLLSRQAQGWALSPEPAPIYLPAAPISDALAYEMDQFLCAIQSGIPSPIPIDDVQPVMEWAWRLEGLAERSLEPRLASKRL